MNKKYNIENNIAFDFYGTQIVPGAYVVYGSRAGDHGIVKRGSAVEVRKGKVICDWDVRSYDNNVCQHCNLERDACHRLRRETYLNDSTSPALHYFEGKYIGISKKRGRAIDPSSCVVVLGY